MSLPPGPLPTAFPELHTARLRLRELCMEDAPAVLALHQDPAVMRWFGTDPVPDLDGAIRVIDAFKAWREAPGGATGFRWALARHGQSPLIGSCGLFNWNRHWRKCTVGYELAQAEWGQGLMREALQAILAWGFAQMQLNRVEALVHADNAASLQLLARLGFQHEGRQREVAYWGGQHHDLLQLSLLRRDWQTQPGV